MPLKQPSGFTLLELMIAIAIIGLLAAFALPNFQRYAETSKRTEAQSTLLELAHFMERHYTVNNTYYIKKGENKAPNLPYNKVPKDSSAPNYEISFKEISSETFILQATPKGSMANDLCGTLSIASNGTKSQSAGSLAQCWKR